MKRIIMHIDMDAFFASVEIREKPWLKGKPVAISGDISKRSVIATASYEARKCGVHSAMPVFKALKLCPKLILIKANHKKYEEISRKIRKIFYSYSPATETASIDEAFIDLSHRAKDFEEARRMAEEIKEKIEEKFRLPLTIGIAPNKLLAKLGSKLGKPNGLKVILPEETEPLLKDIPVDKISGIGQKTAEILKNKFNVRTLGELKEVPLISLYNIFKSYAVFLHNASRGIDHTPVIPDYEKKQSKSVGNSMTFPFDTNNFDYLNDVLKYLSDTVAKRLRTSKLYSKSVILIIRYHDFKTITKRKKLRPTNTSKAIYLTALSILREIKTKDKIRLIGITATDLVNSPPLTLFDVPKEIKNTEIIEKTMDKLRVKYGKQIVNYASLSKNKHF